MRLSVVHVLKLWLSVVHVSKHWAHWLRNTRWLVAGIATVVLALAIAWVLLVPAADWLAHHDVGSAKGPLLQTARDAARGRLLTLGAGLFAAGALLFTARNFTLSREGQVTDRYTKAIEQLGSEKLDVRIGGIYALERVAYDSAKDHPNIMEVLTAFIREHSREQWPKPESDDAPAPDRLMRPDVQAAVLVIRRRNPRNDRLRLVLTGAYLIDANLTGANLTGADLTDTNLVSAVLGEANLTGAFLYRADLTGVFLYRADLTGAQLRTAQLPRADLMNANLTRADLTGVNLTGADLTGADLTGANLANANLTGADLGLAGLTGANLTGANLTGADLTGARWPSDSAVPEGWQRSPHLGDLMRAPTHSDGAARN